MQLPKKLTLGAVAGALPILLGQLPASAAGLGDRDGFSAHITDQSGHTTQCDIGAFHVFNDEGTLLTINVGSAPGNTPCRADTSISVQYIDPAGAERGVSSFSAESTVSQLTLRVGGTAADVVYSLNFTDCVSGDCELILETHTK